MAVMDEFREEREKIKTASPKEKLKYFKDYYLVWVLIGVAVLAIVISIAHSVLTHKEDALSVCLVNYAESEEAQSAVTDVFTERSGIDTKREQIAVESSLYISAETGEDGAETDSSTSGQGSTQTTSGEEGTADTGNYSLSAATKYRYEDEQRLAALVITGSLDLIVTGEDVFGRFIEAEYFAPLDLVYNAEELRAFEEQGRLFYADGKAVGIYMDDAPVLNRYYFYNGEEGQRQVAGFLYCCKHTELAVDFLRFLDGE